MTTKKQQRKLEVIANCTMCGAPIYGMKEILENEQPIVKKSCYCIQFIPITTPTIINPVPQPYYIPVPIPWQPPVQPVWMNPPYFVTCGGVGVGVGNVSVGGTGNVNDAPYDCTQNINGTGGLALTGNISTLSFPSN